MRQEGGKEDTINVTTEAVISGMNHPYQNKNRFAMKSISTSNLDWAQQEPLEILQAPVCLEVSIAEPHAVTSLYSIVALAAQGRRRHQT